MDDIIASMKRAYARDGWLWGSVLFRLGNPFGWADYDQHPEQTFLAGTTAFLRFIFLFYGEYPTPEEIRSKDFDKGLETITDVLRKSCRHFVPSTVLKRFSVEKGIQAHALVRAQDFGFLQNHCNDLPSHPHHLDIGPGLGTHAIYSVKQFQSHYYAVEAVPNTYAVQRLFFRFLCGADRTYLDLIDCENFGIDDASMLEEVNGPNPYMIRHIPSWHLRMVQDSHIDLVTATWTLNEITGAALLWLLSHASRVLKEGGYFYIRDANTLHAQCHQINYDELLVKMGFEEMNRLSFRNRVDFFGIPRLFQKKTTRHYTFNELVDLALGEFAERAHGELHLPETRGEKILRPLKS